ncbi:MAG: hypothetical protein OEX19_12625, partial [Gammaproteobacteria bacterium]|nr:hypothetical protein [Gammaproteobacteria bacterium]
MVTVIPLTRLAIKRLGYAILLLIGSFHGAFASPSLDKGILVESQVTTPPLNPLYTIPLAPVSLLVPGAGHYVRGEKEIAYRLFRSGAGSMLLLLLSGTVLGVTGAADAVVLPMVPLTLFSATSWFSLSIADLTGMTLNQTKEIDYRHRFLSDWSAYVRYRRIDDYFFDTTGYYQFGGELWFDNKVVSGSFEVNPKAKIRLYNADFGWKLVNYSKRKAREGLYLHGAVTFDDNQLGYYRQYSITYGLKSMINLAAFGPHLHQLIATHQIGIQQHFITYQSPNFDDVDRSSGLTGGFDLSW